MSKPDLITLEALLTSSNRYPDRANSPDCTDEVKKNGALLINRVNALLNELGVTSVDVTSGFRTASSNAQVANAAKRSLHMQGKAVDLLDDKEQTLAKLVDSRPDLLKKYDLWLENPDFTKGKNTNWVHLDMGTRTDRPSRKFNP
jgi:hypothetical protein